MSIDWRDLQKFSGILPENLVLPDTKIFVLIKLHEDHAPPGYVVVRATIVESIVSAWVKAKDLTRLHDDAAVVSFSLSTLLQPADVVPPSSEEHLDLDLLVQAQELFGTPQGDRALEALFGSSLRLSKQDRQPTDGSGLRRFNDGPDADEALDERFTRPHSDER